MFKANNKNTDVLLFLMFLLLTLNIIQTFTVSIVDFKQVNVSRERLRNIPGVFLSNSVSPLIHFMPLISFDTP